MPLFRSTTHPHSQRKLRHGTLSIFNTQFFKGHVRTFNFKLIARLTGTLLIIMACAMALPVVFSRYYRDGAQFDLILSALGILLAGLFLRNFVGHNCTYELHEKESFWITAVIWIVVPITCTIPYYFSGAVGSFTDAAFESFSGFTTTGSSILTDLDHVPQGLLVWRALTQWIGGLGLILFIIAILRKLNVGSAHLYDAEFSGTVQRKLHPRISTSVRYMWAIYVGMSVLLMGALLLCGNDLFDSMCTSISAVSTGGFMVHTDGLAGYSRLSLALITVFMLLSGVNIALLFRLVTGRGREVWRNEEFRLYVVLFLLATIVLTVCFLQRGNALNVSLSYSIFHVASTLSTCGLTLEGPERWPFLVSAITFALIILGASAGSTGGGLKIKRVMILVRYVRNYFTRMLHPNAVFVVTMDEHRIDDDYINKIFGFVFMYIMFIVLGAFVLTITGLSIPTAVCVAATNIANLGPSPLIDMMGAQFDYASLMPLAKWTLIALMLVGRIEIFAILAIFSPAYWRR